jgi:hypothetical protein
LHGPQRILAEAGRDVLLAAEEGRTRRLTTARIIPGALSEYQPCVAVATIIRNEQSVESRWFGSTGKLQTSQARLRGARGEGRGSRAGHAVGSAAGDESGRRFMARIIRIRRRNSNALSA